MNPVLVISVVSFVLILVLGMAMWVAEAAASEASLAPARCRVL
jgi:hypothetical protein